jgi:hypothetical protein
MTTRARSRIFAAVAAMLSAAAGCKGGHSGNSMQADAMVGDAAAVGLTPTATVAPSSSSNGSPLDDALPDDSAEIAVRARHLLEAIANDDAALASDILFPRDGWRATRASTDPGKDWDRQVSTPFRRAIHALARRRSEISRAQFVSLDLGSAVVRATPSAHGWTKPLCTIHGSRLTFLVNGRTHVLPVREMTAWRGAWYVTLLR